MAEIVLIHGIGAQNQSEPSLMETWLPALAGGLSNAGQPGLAQRVLEGQTTVAMAFYGKLFLPPGELDAAAISFGPDLAGDAVPSPATTTQLTEPDPFTASLAEEIVRRASDPTRYTPDTPAAAAAVEQAGARPPADDSADGATPSPEEWFLQALDRLPWIKKRLFGLIEGTVVPTLKQVELYLGDPTIHEEVQRIVSTCVDDTTKVIIGHSLGSVVAYDFARTMKDRLPLLLTLGSPLGDQTLVYRRLEPQPPEYPPLVVVPMDVV